MKNNLKNNLPILNLYKKKSLKSGVDTQLLYGDNFKIIKKYKNWRKIKIKKDGYTGYIKKNKFSNYIRPDFKVCVLKAKLFKGPSVRKVTKKFLPYGSTVKIKEKKGKFVKFEEAWLKISDLKKINFKHKNIFKNITFFKNVKYLWGGKSFIGIDCSALVQIFFNANNKYCPRDSKDQEKYFKKKVKMINLQKNDLLFWKGHVAIALSRNKLIHAYGPMKKVVVMDINKTIERIRKTANLNVTSIKRI